MNKNHYFTLISPKVQRLAIVILTMALTGFFNQALAAEESAMSPGEARLHCLNAFTDDVIIENGTHPVVGFVEGYHDRDRRALGFTPDEVREFARMEPLTNFADCVSPEKIQPRDWGAEYFNHAQPEADYIKVFNLKMDFAFEGEHADGPARMETHYIRYTPFYNGNHDQADYTKLFRHHEAEPPADSCNLIGIPMPADAGWTAVDRALLQRLKDNISQETWEVDRSRGQSPAQNIDIVPSFTRVHQTVKACGDVSDNYHIAIAEALEGYLGKLAEQNQRDYIKGVDLETDLEHVRNHDNDLVEFIQDFVAQGQELRRQQQSGAPSGAGTGSGNR